MKFLIIELNFFLSGG